MRWIMKVQALSIVITVLVACQNPGADNDLVFRSGFGASGTVTTLAAGTRARTSIVITWTAVGSPSSYELRYLSGSSCPMTSSNFSSGSIAPTPAPQAAGSTESITVSSLTAGTAYCFGLVMKTSSGLTSALSNTINTSTLPLSTSIGVYGQDGSFVTATANKGGRSADSIAAPYETAVDGTGGLYVADAGNHRVLYFPAGSTTATRVYGQLGSFASGTANNGGVSADSLNGPRGVAVASDGIYISDFSNNRVLFYSGTSTTASRVYGQGTYATNAFNGTASATNTSLPAGIAVDSTGLYVAQAGFHRVIWFSGASTTATRVYGQGGMGGQAASTSATGLDNPTSVALDSTGIYICDFGNNRVTYYPGVTTTATRFYGQSGTTSQVVGMSATRMNQPTAIGVSSLGLYVADMANNRVLYFPHASATAFDSAATLVYGQGGSFTVGGVNNGGISPDSLNAPWGVQPNSNGVYISDRSNNRILFY